MNEEFIGFRFSDRYWVYNLDTLIGFLGPLSAFTALVCTVLCLFLDDSHFVEYKLLSIYVFLHVTIIVFRTQSSFLLYNRRVAILFLQKLQPGYLLLVLKELWINEERIRRKQLVGRVACLAILGFMIGAIFFFLCHPLTWLSVDAVAG